MSLSDRNRERLLAWLKWLFGPLARVLRFPFTHLPTILALLLCLWVIVLILQQVLPGLYAIEEAGFGQFGKLTDEYFQRGKTLWDWMDLLIVPVILAVGALWFNHQAREREIERTNDRFREEALQKYFDSMADLLLEKDAKPEEVKRVATMRTVTVLRRLDAKRRGEVLAFLRVSARLSGDTGILNNASMTTIDLREADLMEANLSGADLDDADLSEANLSLADLSNAHLNAATLSFANLSGAYLGEADLIKVDLNSADLNGANLGEANLSSANLSGANLENADLSGANLENADLSGANLREANLEKCRYNKVTTLPDGRQWSPTTDMGRYTDPHHKAFWQPKRFRSS